MITAYHRPHTLEEALNLLSRPGVLPLGGGTSLSRIGGESIEVVDLQALGLHFIERKGNQLEIGATATLQMLLEDPNCPPALRTALHLEAPLNLRHAATVAGTIVTCDGRSSFVTTLLALDAKLELRTPAGSDRKTGSRAKSRASSPPTARSVTIGHFLPLRPRGLITSIVLPMHVKLAFEYVARTPSDRPVVCAALVRWPSGRTRLALGGWGGRPLLALDGAEPSGLEPAARNVFSEAADEWAGAEYRMEIAATLARRCWQEVGS